MTASLSAAITDVAARNPLGATPTALTAVVGVVLIVLLVERELLNAARGARPARLVRALDVAIVPLLLAFGLAVCLRFARFLRVI